MRYPTCAIAVPVERYYQQKGNGDIMDLKSELDNLFSDLYLNDSTCNKEIQIKNSSHVVQLNFLDVIKEYPDNI